MPKQKRTSSSNRPKTVYVVLQQRSECGEHDVSCVSIHTTLAAANEAAQNFMQIYEDDEGVEKERGWWSYEDLDGFRVQTNKGRMRIISVEDRNRESLAWVEEKTIEQDVEAETEIESDEQEEQSRSDKRRKTRAIDLTE